MPGRNAQIPNPHKQYQAVGINGLKKLYTTECTTDYLQHPNNTTLELWDSYIGI